MVDQVSEISLDQNSLNLVRIKQNNKSDTHKVLDLEILWEYFKRATYKLAKIFLNFKPVKQIREKSRHNKANNYRQALPPLQLRDQKILDDLQGMGTYSTSIQYLNFDSTRGLLEKTRILVNFLKQEPAQDRLFIDLEFSILSDYPEIFLWGIEPRLLDIIEHYIGSPIYYQGFSIRRDIVSNGYNANCVRVWHQDSEDEKVVKIIIYLNDVGVKGGHYEYISPDLSKQVVGKLNYNSGYLDDDKMTAIVSQQDWLGCIGKLGTVIISDTSNCFHRAKPPEEEDRFSISFCYTSNKPKFYKDHKKIFPKNLADLLPKLTEHQRRVLINKNRFWGLKFWLLGK